MILESIIILSSFFLYGCSQNVCPLSNISVSNGGKTITVSAPNCPNGTLVYLFVEGSDPNFPGIGLILTISNGVASATLGQNGLPEPNDMMEITSFIKAWVVSQTSNCTVTNIQSSLFDPGRITLTITTTCPNGTNIIPFFNSESLKTSLIEPITVINGIASTIFPEVEAEINVYFVLSSEPILITDVNVDTAWIFY